MGYLDAWSQVSFMNLDDVLIRVGPLSRTKRLNSDLVNALSIIVAKTKQPHKFPLTFHLTSLVFQWMEQLEQLEDDEIAREELLKLAMENFRIWKTSGKKQCLDSLMLDFLTLKYIGNNSRVVQITEQLLSEAVKTSTWTLKSVDQNVSVNRKQPVANNLLQSIIQKLQRELDAAIIGGLYDNFSPVTNSDCCEGKSFF